MSKIFTPITLGKLTVPNRIARSATHTYLGNPDGTISEDEIELYKKMAENQVGMIISAHSYVSYNGQASADQNSIADDKVIPQLTKAAEAVHKVGGCYVQQIAHAGERAVSNAFHSDVDNITPDSATVEQLKSIKEAFVQAAIRTQKAGCDGVQVHCAHGYFLACMISPLTNHRDDIYGGSAENRFRLAAEIIEQIHNKCGEDYAVLIKINSNIPNNDDLFEKDLVEILRICEKIGVSAVEFSGCDFSVFNRNDHLYYLNRVSRLAKKTTVPLMLVGGIRSLSDMNTALDCGIELVSLSRGLLCEPDLITKLKNGQEKSKCLSCKKCWSLHEVNGKLCVFHEHSFERLIKHS